MNVHGNLARDIPKFTYVPRIGLWAARAACIGTDPALWFLDDQSGSYREARQICAGCPVRPDCLRWAIDTRTDHGLFGGLNPKERRALRYQAGQAQLQGFLWTFALILAIILMLHALGVRL